MILTLLGLAALVVFTVFVARTAGENGRSSVGWAFACAGTGFFFQFVLPFLIGFVSAVYLVIGGTPPEAVAELLSGWFVVIGIVGVILSVPAMFLILRKVAAIPDDEIADDVVLPPPPRFHDEEDTK